MNGLALTAIATIGITDFASELGDIVYVDIETIGQTLLQNPYLHRGSR
jgi:glycine cleavage system H lipoate-binding protein